MHFDWQPRDLRQGLELDMPPPLAGGAQAFAVRLKRVAATCGKSAPSAIVRLSETGFVGAHQPRPADIADGTGRTVKKERVTQAAVGR